LDVTNSFPLDGRLTWVGVGPERILIVFDGQKRCIRHIYIIEHKLDFQPHGIPQRSESGWLFSSVEEAVAAAKEMLSDTRHTPSTRIA
jgi:hypothetical protein